MVFLRESLSLDHLVGAGEQRGRHGEAERPRGRKIDDQLELGRLHNRQVGRVGTLENAADVDAELPIPLGRARSVAHQAARFCKRSITVDGGNCMARRQGGKLEPPDIEQRVGTDHERIDSIANERREGSLDLAAVARPNDIDLHPDDGRRRRHVFRHVFDIRIGRIDQQSDSRS